MCRHAADIGGEAKKLVIVDRSSRCAGQGEIGSAKSDVTKEWNDVNASMPGRVSYVNGATRNVFMPEVPEDREIARARVREQLAPVGGNRVGQIKPGGKLKLKEIRGTPNRHRWRRRSGPSGVGWSSRKKWGGDQSHCALVRSGLRLGNPRWKPLDGRRQPAALPRRTLAGRPLARNKGQARRTGTIRDRRRRPIRGVSSVPLRSSRATGRARSGHAVGVRSPWRPLDHAAVGPFPPSTLTDPLKGRCPPWRARVLRATLTGPWPTSVPGRATRWLRSTHGSLPGDAFLAGAAARTVRH